MRANVSPARRLAVASLALAAFAWGWSAWGPSDLPAQENDRRPEGAARAPSPSPYIFGARYCAECHAHPGDYQGERIRVRMDESSIWAGHDKHRRATEVLRDPRARRMGELLGISVGSAPECLSCHAGVPADAGGRPGRVAAAEVPRQQFDVSEGVSCVACHGAYRDWVLQHQLFEDPVWKGRTRDEKERLLGMADLWDPVKRAKLCVSCHVGNYEKDRVLTHEMYAAGHPPLPSIELVAFGDAMPRHWETLAEKRAHLPGKRPDVREKLEADLDLGRPERAELVAIGGLVAFRESLALWIAQASGGGSAKDLKSRWPDYARFDCQACHHDVSSPTWRQVRGYPSAPGRPVAPAWPTALVPLSIEAAHPTGAGAALGQFRAGLRDVHAAIGDRPFGDKERVVRSAGEMVRWADSLLAELSRTKFERATAARLLGRLAALGREGLCDYESARQLFWAYRAISAEVAPAPELIGRLDALEAKYGFALPGAREPVPLEPTLGARLDAIAGFDPVGFRRDFAEAIGPPARPSP